MSATKHTPGNSSCCNAAIVSGLSPTGWICDACGRTVRHETKSNTEIIDSLKGIETHFVTSEQARAALAKAKPQ